MDSTLKRLFLHQAWADRECIAVLDPADPRCEPSIKLFAHVVAAEHIWLCRIHSRDTGGILPWSELTFPRCRELSAASAEGYLELVRSTDEQKLSNIVDYRMSNGEPNRSSIRDILLHVGLHGAYHRGQIASRLQAQDLPVPSTDFILYSRQLPRDEP